MGHSEAPRAGGAAHGGAGPGTLAVLSPSPGNTPRVARGRLCTPGCPTAANGALCQCLSLTKRLCDGDRQVNGRGEAHALTCPSEGQAVSKPQGGADTPLRDVLAQEKRGG